MSSGSDAFSFNAIADMTSCTPATISWSVVPGTIASFAGLTLAVTNAEIAQVPPPSSTSTGTFPTHSAKARRHSHLHARRTETQVIGQNIDASTGTFTWARVNVADGWYAITATFSDGFDAQKSDPFFVVNRTDTSCLGTTFTASQTSHSSGSTIGQTSHSASHTTESAGYISLSSPSAANTSLVLDTTRHDAKLPPGAVAGIVVGAILVLVAGILVFFLRIRSRHRDARSRDSPTSFSPYPLPSAGTLPDSAASVTALALDRSISAAVVQSQEEMFEKMARMGDSMRALEREQDEETSDTQNVTEQLRAMAQRVALMEARVETLQSGDRPPPEYTVTQPP
ncbi:hypothetical protein B0H13DRAFT_2366694 [Mycena leptocephala]|nr:hypothetical protein B0H13DRAFT_2366694 [Mycena leptocephala]